MNPSDFATVASRFNEAVRSFNNPSHVDGLPNPTPGHRLEHLSVDGRQFCECSCGLVAEEYSRREVCPIAEAEAEYRFAVERAEYAKGVTVGLFRRISEIAAKDLREALASERR